MISALGITVLRILRTAYAALLALCMSAAVLLLVSQIPLAEAMFSADNYAFLIIGLMIYIYLAALLLRVFARTFPLRADLKPRYVIIGVFFLTILLSFVPLASLMLDNPDAKEIKMNITLEGATQEQEAEFAAGVRKALPVVSAFGRFFAAIAFVHITFFLTVLLLIPLLGILSIHIFRRFRTTTILFLRRFGGAADAALMSALIQVAPRGTKIALMASPGSKATSWDPMILIFAGFRWTRPWSNMPIYLQSSELRWRDDVFRWISSSDLVVFDGSDLSDSMTTEWKMIKEAGAASRTILMNGNLSTLPFLEGHNYTAAKVNYQLSWHATAHRIIAGTSILIATAYFAFDVFGVEAATIIGLIALPPMVHRSLTKSSMRELQTAVSEKLSLSRRVPTPTN